MIVPFGADRTGGRQTREPGASPAGIDARRRAVVDALRRQQRRFAAEERVRAALRRSAAPPPAGGPAPGADARRVPVAGRERSCPPPSRPAQSPLRPAGPVAPVAPGRPAGRPRRPTVPRISEIGLPASRSADPLFGEDRPEPE
jgi:hypothetical protein